MVNLEELRQLVIFADSGTLSKAAEELHLSQPTITRSMKHLEDEFEVELFSRSKNKIELNETGMKAVEQARLLINNVSNAIKQIRTFDEGLRTIYVETCAPAPMWKLMPLLSTYFNKKTITSRTSSINSIIDNLHHGNCSIAILPFALDEDEYESVPIVQENLSICVVPDHPLAEKEAVSFEELNHYNFIVRSEIGFWNDIHKLYMPSSNFLVQPDNFALAQLIKNSTIPCFTTNLVNDMHEYLQGRITIPIRDKEAHITFYMVFNKSHIVYKEIAKTMQKRYLQQH